MANGGTSTRTHTHTHSGSINIHIVHHLEIHSRHLERIQISYAYDCSFTLIQPGTYEATVVVETSIIFYFTFSPIFFFIYHLDSNIFHLNVPLREISQF